MKVLGTQSSVQIPSFAQLAAIPGYVSPFEVIGGPVLRFLAIEVETFHLCHGVWPCEHDDDGETEWQEES